MHPSRSTRKTRGTPSIKRFRCSNSQIRNIILLWHSSNHLWRQKSHIKHSLKKRFWSAMMSDTSLLTSLNSAFNVIRLYRRMRRLIHCLAATESTPSVKRKPVKGNFNVLNVTTIIGLLNELPSNTRYWLLNGFVYSE